MHLIDAGRLGAVLFDMDGVLTDTAGVHRQAWTRLFNSVLPELAGLPELTGLAESASGDVRPFDEADYRRFVDGRARIDGVEAVLADRGIAVPRGEIDDAPGTATGWALANRKNEHFHEALADEGVTTFPTTVELLHAARASGLRVAVVTASRNRRDVLAAAGLSDAFDAAVDGTDIEDLGLPGKPDPATYLEAARRVGVDAARAVIVEDARAGVEAGRRGDFGLVIGVARHENAAELAEAGADIVVADLAEVAIGPGGGE